MAFTDESQGIGKAFGIDDTGSAVRTFDGGRTWSPIEVPNLKKIEHILLLSGQIGWITDREGSDLLLFRTIDGGRSWQESRTSIPSQWPSVRQISFVDKDHGWIALTQIEGDEIRLIATSDGGRTWNPVSIPPVRSTKVVPEPDIVGFISEKVGFVFSTDGGESAKNRVLFTADGGAQWQTYSLAYSIGHCQALEGDLRCSGDREGSHFGVLNLHPK